MRVLLVVDYPNSSLDNLAKVIITVLKDKEVEIFLIYRRRLFEIIQRDPQILETFNLVHFLNGVESFPLEIIKYISHICPIITHYHHREYTLIPKQFLFVNYLLYVSNSLLNDVRTLGISTEQTSLMRSGVDTNLFYPQKSKENSKSFTIGFFGARPLNSYDRKGSVLLLHALRKVVDLGYRPSLLVVGYGWKKLVSDLRKMGLMVIYYVNAPYCTLPSLYRKLDLYLITSLLEGGPLTLLEAGACGISVISTPVGLSLEILSKPLCGKLLRGFDIDEIASAIVDDIEQPQAAQERALCVLEDLRNNWNWQRTYQNLYKIYKEVIRYNEKEKSPYSNFTACLDFKRSANQQRILAKEDALADLAFRLYSYGDWKAALYTALIYLICKISPLYLLHLWKYLKDELLEHHT
jgi:glycosyltransferase involved in cell wall biosynthesis